MTTTDLSPFPVDPEVLARIRAMEADDLDQVCRLHEAAMGRSLWAQLGVGFLRRVYRGLLDHDDFLGYVYCESGRVRGFIAGTANGPRMLREVLRRRSLWLILATAWGLLKRPSAAWPLLETLRYFRKSSQDGLAGVSAESMFCSFEPELRGRRVSGLINKVLFDELAARGHRYVKITTEIDNSGAVRQLTSWGFEQVGRFRFYGKEMITWRLDLTSCDRVDPAARDLMQRSFR
jgi:ribosomal protein S18 acetylase RimI-like enzyme